MYALDTNMLVHYIVQDDKEQAQRAAGVLESLTSDEPAFVSCLVLCEINWVLKTAYKISKEERVAVLSKIMSVASFHIERLRCCKKALKRFERGRADFSDYLIALIAMEDS